MKVTIYDHPDENRLQLYFSYEAIKALNTSEIVITVHPDVIAIRPTTIDDKKFSKISKAKLSSFMTERIDIIGEYTLQKDTEFDDFILVKQQ